MQARASASDSPRALGTRLRPGSAMRRASMSPTVALTRAMATFPTSGPE